MITSLDSNGLRFDMLTGEERFIAPNAVLVSARTDAVLIDCGFVKNDDCRSERSGRGRRTIGRLSGPPHRQRLRDAHRSSGLSWSFLPRDGAGRPRRGHLCA
jgi:hypothetical protein